MREAFKGGEFDLSFIGSSRDWALDYKGDFVKKGYYLRKKLPHTRVAGMQGFAMNMRNPIFKSRKVRAAIAMVMDFDWSNRNLFYNQYTRNDCYFDNNPELKAQGIPQGEVKKYYLTLGKNMEKYLSLKRYSPNRSARPARAFPSRRNIALANKLLDSDGWQRGAKGFRQKKRKAVGI